MTSENKRTTLTSFDESILFRVEKKKKEFLIKQAEKSGVTLSDYMRLMVNDFLDKKKKVLTK